MTQVNITKLKEIYQEAVEKDEDFMRELLTKVLQELLEIERDKQIGVKEYIRDEKQRKGLRNGYKNRELNTRLGKLKLLKPQIREFPFKTDMFENYQRSEKALISAIIQMVIDGVSTNKVKKITDKLSSDLSFSKSTVSRLMKELDPMIESWRTEKLNENYAYLISDACYFYVRENSKVVKRPLLISVGVDKTGYRKILGVDMKIDESEESWREHILSLKERGLKTVGLTISDKHKGLVKVLEEEFSGSPHQRCMVHFERNLLSKVPAKERKMLSSYLKMIYNCPDKEMAFKIANLISDKYRGRYPKVSKLLDENVEETLTFYSYLRHHHRKIRTTNLIEGTLNSMLKRRSKVVGIFPNRDSAIRYACSLLIEIDEDWQTNRRYMRMLKEDNAADFDEDLMIEITQLKQKSKIKKELVTL